MNRDELLAMKQLLERKVIEISCYGLKRGKFESDDYEIGSMYALKTTKNNQKALEIIETFIENILIVMNSPEEYFKSSEDNQSFISMSDINEIGIWPDFTFYFDEEDVDLTNKKIKENAKPLNDYIRIELYDFSCNDFFTNADEFKGLDRFAFKDFYLTFSLDELKQMLKDRGFSISDELTVEKLYEDYCNGIRNCLVTVNLSREEEFETPGR